MDIQTDHWLAANVDEVFAAWISQETVIPPAVKMEIEPRVGGLYRLTAEGPGFTAVAEGRFTIVDPPTHLRYSWEWNQDGDVSTIDVRFEPERDGTRVRLEHTNLATDESFENHRQGWQSYFAGLEQWLAQPENRA